MPERQKFVDECGSKYPAGDVKTQIRQAFHNGGNTFFYRFRCLFFGLNGLIGALRKFQILPSGCSWLSVWKCTRCYIASNAERAKSMCGWQRSHCVLWYPNQLSCYVDMRFAGNQYACTCICALRRKAGLGIRHHLKRYNYAAPWRILQLLPQRRGHSFWYCRRIFSKQAWPYRGTQAYIWPIWEVFRTLESRIKYAQSVFKNTAAHRAKGNGAVIQVNILKHF